MARQKKTEAAPTLASPKDKAKAYVRKVFTNAKQKVIFDHNSKREGEMTAALRELDIAFVVGDTPYETSTGGLTFKHTLFVKGTERLQAILDEKD